MLKFSPANAKIKALSRVAAIKPYLMGGKRKVYSFDLLSGVNCPYAKDCNSRAVVGANGKRTIVDGPDTQFRCFSASQEVLFSNLFKLREANGEILEIAAKSAHAAATALAQAMPKNAGVIRIHVGGDFKTRAYFDAWVILATCDPNRLYYAYTKSLPFWVNPTYPIPDNLVLTASRGGWKDDLIAKHGLRETVVVGSVYQARKLGLQIDHDDSHAANPAIRNRPFALLIHGTQPAGSEWGKAVKRLKGKGSYSR